MVILRRCVGSRNSAHNLTIDTVLKEVYELIQSNLTTIVVIQDPEELLKTCKIF